MAMLTSVHNLAVVHPKIAKQWHPTKNGNLTPAYVTPSNNTRVWWLCQKGHEWQVSVSNRVHFGTGCPFCSGKRVSADNCLESVLPHIASQWHPTKNKGLTPKDVTPGSRKKVYWICENGHEWQAQVSSRLRGSGCPLCAKRRATKQNNLKKKNPRLAKQWHPTKNEGLLPQDVTPRSAEKVWWICGKGHEWEATVVARSKGTVAPTARARKPVLTTVLKPSLPILQGVASLQERQPDSKNRDEWLGQKSVQEVLSVQMHDRFTNFSAIVMSKRR